MSPGAEEQRAREIVSRSGPCDCPEDPLVGADRGNCERCQVRDIAAALRAAREEGIEEAAKVTDCYRCHDPYCDDGPHCGGTVAVDIGKEIRNLKGGGPGAGTHG